MKTRREVHSLDYSLSILVSLLDHVFRGRCEWWDVSRGLDIEIHDSEMRKGQDASVQIRPVGWRKDEMIVVRCMNTGHGWWPFEGCVHSPRLPGDLGFQFPFQTNWPPYTLKALGTSAERFLKEACPGWFEERPS